jgi:heptaprenyl diphosphate synthase
MSNSTVVAGVDIGDVELAGSLDAQLAEVERVMLTEISRGESFVTPVAEHLARAGGKRFRPLVTLMSARFGNRPVVRSVIDAAVIVELVHLATLYHDDVMDEASVRRGVPSVNARWDNNVAILAGDYLFAQASRMGASLGTDAVHLISVAFSELVTGQLRESIEPTDVGAIDHHLQVLSEKTGSLLSLCGELGGLCTEASENELRSLHRLGHLIGMAFQISDDIIDITSTQLQSGKVPGTDLREGVNTLPTLYALREDGGDPVRLRELLSGPIQSDDDVTEALDLLRSSKGLAQARSTLRQYVDDTRRELKQLPSGPTNSAFEKVAMHLLDRAC